MFMDYDSWKTTPPDETDPPECPKCGAWAKKFFLLDGELLGCDQCIDAVDADDYTED